jgi:hypothetical protein
VGNHVIRDKFLPYKLIENVIYPMQPWIYFPFKNRIMATHETLTKNFFEFNLKKKKATCFPRYI